MKQTKQEIRRMEQTAAYYQTRGHMPDDYDPQPALDRAIEAFRQKFETKTFAKSWTGWLNNLAENFRPEDVWEFLDYDDFPEVLARRYDADPHHYGEVRIKLQEYTLKGYPNHFIECLILPSRFNNLKHPKFFPAGLHMSLTAWFRIMFPNDEYMAKRVIGRNIMSIGPSRSHQDLIDQIKYDIDLWADNVPETSFSRGRYAYLTRRVT